MEVFVSGKFKSIQTPMRGEEGKDSPKDIDNRARISGGGRGKCKQREGKQ